MLTFERLTEHNRARAENLPWYDNTKMTAMNTCPTYAALAYGLNKRMYKVERQLALEAGALCHDVFAFVRLFDLLLHGEAFYAKPQYSEWRFSLEAVHKRGRQIFNDRWDSLMTIFNSQEDVRTKLFQSALHIVNTSTYYDDINDTRRTITNIEDAVLEYCNQYTLNQRMPVCHDDFVGVEQTFEVLVYLHEQAICVFVGKLDGLCWSAAGNKIELHENKTGARIDKVWEASYTVSHQVTGYIVAASTVLNANTPWQGMLDTAQMYGLAIPQVKKPVNVWNFLRSPVTRDNDMIEAWATWFIHTYNLWSQYGMAPSTAPRYTHSCSRYFSACPYIPFCTSPADTHQEMIEGMFDHTWDPREEGV